MLVSLIYTNKHTHRPERIVKEFDSENDGWKWMLSNLPIDPYKRCMAIKVPSYAVAR